MGLSAKAEKSGSCGPNLKWYLTYDGVLIISGKGEMYDYKSINDRVWEKTHVKRIIIGDSVTTIGWSAFRDCNSLTSVTIPYSVTKIGIAAFRDCSSLTSVIIPNSVTKIGDGAFSDCIYNHRTTKTNQKYPSVNL